MIVFNLKNSILSAMLLVASNIVALASSSFTDPIEGVKTDTLDGGYQDFSKYYNRTFSVDKSTIVVLSNKYGSIDVHTGTGSQVIVKVKVTVTSTTQSLADKVFDRVNIAFIEGPEFVKTETMIENPAKSNPMWSDKGGQDFEFRIDYDVTMPVGNRLDITNRHGNSTIAALTTSVKIDQKYGDFRLDGATSATVVLAYGGGQLSALNTLNGSVSYGRLTSPSIKNGRLKSIYSQFRFDEIGSLDIESAYDTYDINEIINLNVKCKYSAINTKNMENLVADGNCSAIKVIKLQNNADIKSFYGTVRIGGIKNKFGQINITGNNTDCILLVDQAVSYMLDFNGSYTNISQPASMHTKLDNKEPAHREVIGVVGNNPNPKSFIRVRMTYGDFKIK